MVSIIKKLMEDNKKGWDSKMKFSLWVDRVTTKRSTGTSSFQLVYGIEAIFLVQLSLLIAKFLVMIPSHYARIITVLVSF
jgi:hypothetical protein